MLRVRLPRLAPPLLLMVVDGLDPVPYEVHRLRCRVEDPVAVHTTMEDASHADHLVVLRPDFKEGGRRHDCPVASLSPLCV